ncbi:MAG TPA: hypothetical protein VIV14_07300 [Gammaproteobacteria bacterium]
MRFRTNNATIAALLVTGSAVSSSCLAHWEGVEAADPATPAALLNLDTATDRYIASDSAPLPWRERFANGSSGHEAHAGHADAAEQTPATTQQ